jgi:hypothetical protein
MALPKELEKEVGVWIDLVGQLQKTVKPFYTGNIRFRGGAKLCFKMNIANI